MTIACKRMQNQYGGLHTTRIHTNTELKRSVFGLIVYNNNAIISEITIKNIKRNLRIAAYLITGQFWQNKRCGNKKVNRQQRQIYRCLFDDFY